MKAIMAIGLAVLSILAAPVAWADKTRDNVYLNGLLEDGIDLDGVGRATLLKAAHDICAQLDRGNMSLKAMVALVAVDVPSIPARSEEQAALIGDAMGAYCPEYAHQLN
jgi:hypothetical protein